MRVGLVGINHKLADLKLRELLAKACHQLFRTSHSFHAPHAFILLSTCNRTEVYFTSSDLTDTHTYLLNMLRREVEEDFDQKLYSYFGIDCFLHLARVATGLDSAIVGETEIQGQVKTAYETAIQDQPLPKELHFLFQKALGIAKKVRSEIHLGRGMPNLEHAIFNTGKHFFQERLELSRILFVGASEINQKILDFFGSKNLNSMTICNRSHEHAEAFALKKNLQLLDWNDFAKWQEYDWIILATKSPAYLIRNEELSPFSKKPQLIMDLSVPRNVDPAISQNRHLMLWNIDQLNHLLKIRYRWLERSLQDAEVKIARAVREHTLRYKHKEHAKLTILAVTA